MSKKFMLTATRQVIFLAISLGWLSKALVAAPVISEFMARNVTTLTDEDGAYSDWIEIFNPDTTAVNLSGWRLTDSATSLSKWVFPAVTLQPGEFIVVFASGKNRVNPATGPLHTNFSLSEDGEYLALISPTGVKSTEYAPRFPKQQVDRSYGALFDARTLIAPGASARYLVPTATTPTTWKNAGFNDTSWSTGTTGLGYGLLIPGMTVVEARSSTSIHDINAAENLMEQGINLVAGSTNTQIRQVINFLGEGSDGNFSGNVPFAVGGDTHAMKVSGYLSIPAPGTYTFGVNSDDGFQLYIDLNRDGVLAGKNGTLPPAAGSEGEVITYFLDGRGPSDSFGTATFAAAGTYLFDLIYFENYGGDGLEFFAAPGSFTTFNSNFRLVGDTAAGGLQVFTPTLNSGGANAGIVQTNVQTALQNVNSSLYARIGFTKPSDFAGAAYTLVMRYNDGFASFFDGVGSVSQNAPSTSLSWNSASTATRTLEETLSPRGFNVTASINALSAGAHTLALQGLNSSAADSNFLLLPELVGGKIIGTESFYYAQATPGSINNTTASNGPVADTTFSVKRGIYTTPQNVVVTTPTPGASLAYTLDGSVPSPSHGTQVLPANATTAPVLNLTISSTTVLRVMAYKAGFDSTNVDTNTYIFPADVVTQSTTTPPAGWPTSSVNGQIYNYGMDPTIVNNTNTAIGGVTQTIAALTSIPSISLVLPIESLVNQSTGIYSNPWQEGFAWERAASIEMLNDPTTTDRGFQENCGLRIRGGFSRSGDNPKHAFRIFFRRDYGAGKLNYPLFPNDDTAAKEFDKFDLQTSQNYSWAFQGDSSNTFLRELWSRDTQLALKQPSARGRFVHLYLNGLYWGLYQIEERPEASFGESYLGGKKENFDVPKAEAGPYDTVPTAGNLKAWRQLWDGNPDATAENSTGVGGSRAVYFYNNNLNPVAPHGARVSTLAEKNGSYFALMGLQADGKTPLANAPVLLDVDNLIDYMMIIFYGGNTDAPLSAFLGNNSPNNYFSLRDRTGTRGFIHIIHDAEHTLDAGAAHNDRVGPFNDPITGTWDNFRKSNPQFTHQDLAANLEYRMRFADRIQKHMINPNGAMTTTANINRMVERATIVESAIIAESARWGDAKVSTPYTANTWRTAKNNTLNWFNNRNSQMISIYRNAGLFPQLNAPVYSQHGGPIALTTPLRINGSGGTIYYTINGVDPRDVGGGINPTAVAYTPGTAGTNVSLISPNATGWSYLVTATEPSASWKDIGFNASGWPTGQATLGYGDPSDQNTNVGYVSSDPSNPSLTKNITTYFRKNFTVVDKSIVTGLTVRLKRDDGAVVYLNGQEIVRDNLPAGLITTNTIASNNVNGADETTFYEFAVSAQHLVNGTNVIAAEVHQVSAGSSDISFDLELVAAQSGTPSPALPLSAGIAKVKSRVRDSSGNWSALNEAEFIVGGEIASEANLVISELMYHPSSPTAAEVAAGFTSDSDFEFIELMNTATLPIDLGGVYFADGVNYTFSDASTPRLLPAGQRVCLVRNLAAFRSRYGAGPSVVGVYTGELSNAGERVWLKTANGTTIRDFTYDDIAPWPTTADGTGPSLSLLRPQTRPDHSVPTNWRSGSGIGSPGVGDNFIIDDFLHNHGLTDMHSDPDHDGLTSLTEYLFGTNPLTMNAPGPVTMTQLTLQSANGSFKNYLVSFERRKDTLDTDYILEKSTQLAPNSWNAINLQLFDTTDLGNGKIRVRYRLDQPLPLSESRMFFRARGRIIQ